MSVTVQSSSGSSLDAPLRTAVDAAVSGRRGLYVAGEPGKPRTEFIKRLIERLPLGCSIVTWLSPGAEPSDVVDLLTAATAERAGRGGAGQILLVVDYAELLPNRTLALLNQMVTLLESEASPRFVVAGSPLFEARLAGMAPLLQEYLSARVEVARLASETARAAATNDGQSLCQGGLSPAQAVAVQARPERRAAMPLDRGMMVAAAVGACLMAVAIGTIYQSARHGAPLESSLPARPGPAVIEAQVSPQSARDATADSPPSHPGEQSVTSLQGPPVPTPALPVSTPDSPVDAVPLASKPVPVDANPALPEDYANAAVTPPSNDLPLWLRRGGPGLILVARRHDTLHGLYRSIYTGVRPPPFSVVQDANPNPIRPGTVVVFPTPPDGWSKPPG